MNDIFGKRAIIYVFPCQLLIPGWPQHSTAYAGLKGQAGHVVTGVFINLAHRNTTPNRKLEADLYVNVDTGECVHAIGRVYASLLYDCGFSWHPQLSLNRITNFTVTFTEKLLSGDNIKTKLSYQSYKSENSC